MPDSAKPTRLTMRWSKRENDFVTEGPTGRERYLMRYYLCCEQPRSPASWCDGAMMPARFDPSFIQELEKLGYDLTTLKFSIERKRTDA
jgi:uncharacterized protein YfeS